MADHLQKKLAVVTGATRGIGFAIAERLLADGADVIATGTRPGGKGPNGAEYADIDFTDDDALARFADDLSRRRPDILVNNAGINIVSDFADIDPDDFERMHRINLAAPMRLCRAVLPAMRERKWGRIVNISSIWGKIAREGRASYAATKFGIDGLTAALAAEAAADGVLANCVAPGFIDTELTRRNLGADGIALLIKEVPCGRLGQPQEIAALVAWLASAENSYISGQNIAIDGGFTRV
jgi:NAD(P)-dependent dehydrogenase (short-subunit alcohol dehydrogenase family)